MLLMVYVCGGRFSLCSVCVLNKFWKVRLWMVSIDLVSGFRL